MSPTASRKLVGALVHVVAPGAGHIMLTRGRRAACFLAALVALLVAAPWLPYALLAFMLVWFGLVVDLLLLRRVEPRPWGEGVWRAGVVMVASVSLLIFVRGFYMQTYKTPSAGMAPTLAIGDHIIAVDRTVAGDPEPGDVIVFWYPCDPGLSFVKRVIAVGGDTVETRCDQVYVNGEALRHEAAPGACSYRDVELPGEPLETVRCDGVIEHNRGRSYRVAYRPEASARSSGFPRVARTGEAIEPACMNREPGFERELPVDDPASCERAAVFTVPDGHVFVMGDNRDHSADSRMWGTVPLSLVTGRATMRWWPFGRIGAID